MDRCLEPVSLHSVCFAVVVFFAQRTVALNLLPRVVNLGFVPQFCFLCQAA